MTKPSAKNLAAPSTGSVLTAMAAGLVLGRVVMGLSARHHGSTAGLIVALVFLLAGAASVTLFLAHWHLQRRGGEAPVPVPSWLSALGAGVLASIHFEGTFAG